MKVAWSKFNMKVAVGIFGDVAVLSLSEQQVSFEGDIIPKGSNSLIRDDLSATDYGAVVDVIHDIVYQGEDELDSGTYCVTGIAKLDEDSCNYQKVKVGRIEESPE